MPPVAGAALGAAASIYSGNRAADASANAARSANATQLQMFREGNALNAPWRAQGTSAVNLLGNAYTGQPGGVEALNAGFFQSPGYQFRLEQGQNQLDRLAARGGNFFSGRALQGAQEYGQNFASNEFGNYINQLNALAGLGGQAAGQSSGQAIATGQGMAGNFNNMGNARAGAYLNQGNALNSLIGQGMGWQGYNSGKGTGSGASGTGTAGGGTATWGVGAPNGGWGQISWNGMLPYGGG